MMYAFVDKDGVEKVFDCSGEGIAGFCGGSYLYNFRVYSNIQQFKEKESWNKPSFINSPLPNPQALLEEIIKWGSTTFMFLHDVSKYRGSDGQRGVADQLFHEITGGTVKGDFSYTVQRIESFNWNSGNDVVTYVITKTDLADRFNDPDDDDDALSCGCCACCGCSCEPIYEDDY